MPALCDYNCADLPEHEQVDCGEYLKGGINAFAYLECDHTITDFSDASQWVTNIAAGKAKIFGTIRGSFPEPAPVEGENPNACGAQTIVDNFDRTFDFKDYNVSDGNNSLYNAVNRRNGYLVTYHCEDGIISVVEASTTWTVNGPIFPENNREKAMYHGIVKWTNYDMPAIYTAPVGIFS